MESIPWRENPSRIKLFEFVREASNSVPASSMILDAGAGEGMYKALFETKKYVSIDLGKIYKTYGDISAISNLDKIPFSTDQFDLVVCTQVLEHVNDPKSVLNELWRVLKPGSCLWISVPFFFEQHEIPYDYYRYTTFGLKFLLESSNFDVQRLNWLEGYYGALAYQMGTAAKYFKTIKRNYLIFLLLKLLANNFTKVETGTPNPVIDQPFLYGKNLIAIALKKGNI